MSIHSVCQLSVHVKDGSWNARESARTRGHILTNVETHPYCRLCEVLIVIILHFSKGGVPDVHKMCL